MEKEIDYKNKMVNYLIKTISREEYIYSRRNTCSIKVPIPIEIECKNVKFIQVKSNDVNDLRPYYLNIDCIETISVI